MKKLILLTLLIPSIALAKEERILCEVPVKIVKTKRVCPNNAETCDVLVARTNCLYQTKSGDRFAEWCPAESGAGTLADLTMELFPKWCKRYGGKVKNQ